MVKDSWIDVCYEQNVQVELEEDVFKLVLFFLLFFRFLIIYQVTNQATQLRGAFKSLSKPYVLQAYNISPQAPKWDIRDQIEALLDGA